MSVRVREWGRGGSHERSRGRDGSVVAVEDIVMRRGEGGAGGGRKEGRYYPASQEEGGGELPAAFGYLPHTSNDAHCEGSGTFSGAHRLLTADQICPIKHIWKLHRAQSQRMTSAVTVTGNFAQANLAQLSE